MENQNSFDRMVHHQNLLSLQIQAVEIQLEFARLRELQNQVLQCNFCGGNHQHGACDTYGGGYSYQPQFDYMMNAPSSGFNVHSNTYLPSMMNYPDYSYNSSNFMQPDSFQFMQNPLDSGAQEFYQPYGSEFSNSQEVRESSQGVSPNLEAAFLSFMQSADTCMQNMDACMQESQATFKTHEASLSNLENSIGQVSKQLLERPLDNASQGMVVNLNEECLGVDSFEESQVEAFKEGNSINALEAKLVDSKTKVEENVDQEPQECLSKLESIPIIEHPTPQHDDELGKGEVIQVEAPKLDWKFFRENKIGFEWIISDFKTTNPSLGVLKMLIENEAQLISPLQGRLSSRMKKPLDEEGIPWDPGGELHKPPLEAPFLSQAIMIMRVTFDRLLASNFKPP